MQEKLIIVLDCGATNVRAVAVSESGTIQAIHKLPNITHYDPFHETGLIWDIDEIWNKLTICIRAVLAHIESERIAAITVTSFGVNGAPVDSLGNLLYPVISWQCQRTIPVMERVHALIPEQEIYSITGIYPFSFNTLYVLQWLKENKPDVLDQMAGFLFISSIIIHKLSGELVNDTSMAGTSMLTNITTRKISMELLSRVGLPNKFFNLLDPGAKVGETHRTCEKIIGLPKGIPVILSGHDTQFALLGAGVRKNEVALSSGTWEILMTRSDKINLSTDNFKAGITNELDAVSGLYNSGKQWLASGVLEWIKNIFYNTESKISPDAVYERMITEAKLIHAGENQIDFMPDLAPERGIISGIGLHTSRGQIYRAALDALVESTYEALKLLEAAGKFKADALVVAGGGGRNELWNQLRADRLKIPVKLVKEKETTVIGAAMHAFSSAGVFNHVDESIAAIAQEYEIINPE